MTIHPGGYTNDTMVIESPVCQASLRGEVTTTSAGLTRQNLRIHR
jgi:hypothetical protein